MSREVRILGVDDEALLVSFLEQHLESSVFLLSNAEKNGVVDRGEPGQATYAACLSEGVITAVAAHGQNGYLGLQGDLGLEDAARLAAATSGRAVKGLIGPLALVRRSRAALGLATAPVARDLEDRLYVLALEELRVPALLRDPELTCRHPTDDELSEPLASWRADYLEEVIGAERTVELERQAYAELKHWRSHDSVWILTRRGTPVSMTGFNAKVRDIVQVGGVYTPPELRGNGYAQAAVAGSLLWARERGVRRSTLVTGIENSSAVRAYTNLGYRAIGEFGLLFFR